METILLGFCLLSLMISSFIVGIELVRDRLRHKRVVQPIPSMKKKETRLVSSETQQNRSHHSSRANIKVSPQHFDILKQELSLLGYHTLEQQLKFLNWVLNSQYSQITALTPQELKKAIMAVQRYKTSQKNSIPSLVAQSALGADLVSV